MDLVLPTSLSSKLDGRYHLSDFASSFMVASIALPRECSWFQSHVPGLDLLRRHPQ